MNKKVILAKNEERRILAGHLWIFSNEIFKVSDNLQNGDIVDVESFNGKYLGTGFFNKNSLISVRIFSKIKNKDTNEILTENIHNAFLLRKKYLKNRNSYRLTFSESDLLPGLIIDKYNYTFVMQINSFGMEKNISPIINYLITELKAKNIFTKNESYFRKLEGLDDNDKVYLGTNEVNEIITDGNVYYQIKFNNSQKTGFFFDQVDNRIYASKFCKDAEVLDLFANSGGFGLNALKAGANHVTFVDYSENEIDNIKNNLTLNNFFDKFDLITDDAFTYLEKQISNGKKFDVVMVDPPAFTKSKKNLKNAIMGYEKLNNLALKCVRNMGLLVTSSCSHHLTKDEFIKIVNKAALKNNKVAKLLYFNTAGPDHPVNPAMEETSYLKFAIFNII
ncbi:MAG TPA: class I SAM-dependent rRNA methyltransferase [Ignavibacteriales bacterium]|nr:class I SAM-dependent rRNA methyltransferase [Ignavibacteriales bacterium]